MILLCAILHTSSADAPMQSTLPERYLQECPERGTVATHYFRGNEELKVWTPYGYSENRLYEIVLLMHGDYGSADSWLTKQYTLFDRTVAGRDVFDWMTYEKRTVPFIVVTLNNKPLDPEAMVRDILEVLLFVADNYSVYPKSTVESLIDNRDHVTVGGLSRGSMMTHWFLPDPIRRSRRFWKRSRSGSENCFRRSAPRTKSTVKQRGNPLNCSSRTPKNPCSWNTATGTPGMYGFPASMRRCCLCCRSTRSSTKSVARCCSASKTKRPRSPA